MLVQGDALRLPLRDASVDLIVTSPPYFALRSYQDAGGHYDGQIGSEPTPHEFLDALWAATAEMVRVLKPCGSLFVNLGDKYSGSGGNGNSGLAHKYAGDIERITPSRGQTWGMRAKSLMGLPWRYAIGCIDHLGLILRAELIWSKPNGLPESVTDRVRRSHEQWFHLTREPRYYSAVDEIREETGGDPRKGAHANRGTSPNDPRPAINGHMGSSALGKLPGSVWTIPSEPLRVPDWLNVDHFAAFPQEWPRRLILGWSPPGVCVECGEGRRPQVDKELVGVWHDAPPVESRYIRDDTDPGARQTNRTTFGSTEATITGYVCACPTPDAPTRPAVVLDPFAGTGTVPMVARALGRTGIGVDLSSDYLRLARWRIANGSSKTVARTNAERQGALVFEEAS